MIERPRFIAKTVDIARRELRGFKELLFGDPYMNEAKDVLEQLKKNTRGLILDEKVVVAHFKTGDEILANVADRTTRGRLVHLSHRLEIAVNTQHRGQVEDVYALLDQVGERKSNEQQI